MRLLSQLFDAHLGRKLKILFGTGGDAGGSGGSLRLGTLFYPLGRLDQLRQPSLHGASIKIVPAG